MALSDQATFSLTVNDIIQEAYDRIGGDPILGYDVRSARRSLNIMFSDWANRGYNQWTVEEKDLTLVKSTISYDLPADTIDIINANIKESDGGHLDNKDINRIYHYVNQITDPEVKGLLQFILVKPFPLSQVIQAYRKETGIAK